jgi:hypothetical protein
MCYVPRRHLGSVHRLGQTPPHMAEQPGQNLQQSPCSAKSERRRRYQMASPSRGKPASSQSMRPPSVATHISVAAIDQRPIERHTHETVHIRAVDDDLVVHVERLVKLVGSVEVKRTWDVLGVVGPPVESHDELDGIIRVEFCSQLLSTDGLNGTSSQGRLWMWGADHREPFPVAVTVSTSRASCRRWRLRTEGARRAGRRGELCPSGRLASRLGRAQCPGRCRGIVACPGRRSRDR